MVMKLPTNLSTPCLCLSSEKVPSRLMYSTCLTAEIFVPLGFLSDLSRKWNIATKILSFLQPTAGSRSGSDWQIFFGILSRRDAGFLAFHFVKCGSEHFPKIIMIAYPSKTACTIFAQFFGHSMTNSFLCVTLSLGGEFMKESEMYGDSVYGQRFKIFYE